MMKRAWLIIPMALLLVLAGCSGDDDDNNTGPGTNEMSQAQAESYIPLIIGNLDYFVTSFADWAVITRGGDRDDEPGWDGEAWSWEDSGEQSYEGTTLTWEYSYWLQYLDSEGDPVQFYDDASSLQLVYTGELTSTDTAGTSTFGFDWDMTYTGLQTDVVNMTGQGDWNASYTGTQGNYDFAMGWGTGQDGIDIPEEGCPDGLMYWDLPPYELQLDYNDPAGFVSWRLYENGSLVNSGQQAMDCN